jgi:hypothetical protein
VTGTAGDSNEAKPAILPEPCAASSGGVEFVAVVDFA